jgi:prevent-host-death family protein
MTAPLTREMPLAYVRAHFTEVLDAAHAGTTTIVTRNGVRLAAITPLDQRPDPAVVETARRIIEGHRGLLDRLGTV